MTSCRSRSLRVSGRLRRPRSETATGLGRARDDPPTTIIPASGVELPGRSAQSAWAWGASATGRPYLSTRPTALSFAAQGPAELATAGGCPRALGLPPPLGVNGLPTAVHGCSLSCRGAAPHPALRARSRCRTRTPSAVSPRGADHGETQSACQPTSSMAAGSIYRTNG
jgi:hypothetical protein